MRLILLSDTHGKHRQFEIPEGDVLVFAGDMMTHGFNHVEIMDFNAWLGEMPHMHKIVIAGNHDRLFETNPSYARGLLTNATYLENSGCEIAGLKFWGSPYTPAFCNWAFNSTPEQLRQHWSLIPEDTDVLITHGPPYGCGSLDRVHPNPKHPHLGCKELAEAVKRVEPQLHVWGHIHGGYGGDYGNLGSEKSKHPGLPMTNANASLVNEAYQPVNKPIVVEL